MPAGSREPEYLGGNQADFQSSPGHGSVVGSGGQQAQGTEPNVQQIARYRFSPEEMKAIRECNRESFYYRCLPIGTVLGCGAYYGVRYGYLKPSPRFGAGPKMFFASIVGYFIGKFSYQHVCAEKLMALPNSHLGDILRKQKGRMGFQETLSMEPGFATAAPVGTPAFANSDLSQSQVYTDVGDTRPMSGFDNEGNSGFSSYDYNDTTQKASNYDTTQQMLDDENLPPKRPQFFTTYDDLRRQNRIDYETRQYSRNQPPPPPPSPSTAGTDPRGTAEGQGYYESRRNQSYPNQGDGKPRNKYGDVWDDKPGSY